MNKSLVLKNKFYFYLSFLFTFFLFVYLLYFLVNGERGLLKYFSLKNLNTQYNQQYMSLKNENEFKEFMQNFMEAIKSGNSAREYEKILSNNAEGLDLLYLWKEKYEKVSDEFAESDPKKRVKWAGPDMSVRSSITARHMETWAHGQEIFDQLGFERIDTDRIKNIVVIGVNTFGWTFINRNLAVPEKMPKLSLLSPSNKLWEWNEDNEENVISGSATEFGQVVTQVRHIDDTSLEVSGKIANEWMSIAQCFAGPPENPPDKGTRFTRKI